MPRQSLTPNRVPTGFGARPAAPEAKPGKAINKTTQPRKRVHRRNPYELVQDIRKLRDNLDSRYQSLREKYTARIEELETKYAKQVKIGALANNKSHAELKQEEADLVAKLRDLRAAQRMVPKP